MRFYGAISVALLLLFLLIPLCSVGLGTAEEKEQERSLPTEEMLIAVVEPLESNTTAESSTGSEQAAAVLPLVAIEAADTVQIWNQSTQSVDSVAIEDFVRGAVCSEMPATFHKEALKAQAVSARTWALYQMLWQQQQPENRLQGADFQADPQNWKGYVTEEQARERFGENFEEYWDKIVQAVNETQGQILCYQGEVIAAAYHAISAGQTESAQYIWGYELPYLQAVESRGDEVSPAFEETVTVSEQDLVSAFSALQFSGEPLDWLEVIERSPSGYVTKIRVGEQTISGLDFRSALKLRSSHMTISHDEAGFHVTTHGYGHGAGLSQYGADFMARQGHTYQEILAHYYFATDLCMLDLTN